MANPVSRAGSTRSVVVVSLLVAGACAAFLAACPGKPAPSPAPQKPASEPPVDATKMLTDPKAPVPEDLSKIFQDEDRPVIVFTLPELPFEEHSKGLPNSGTWRGYPLLHDFNKDGLADLVASNREEDGYNAWEASKTGPWVRRIEGLPRDMAYGPARARDFDGDGHDDLLLSAHTDAIRLYLNDGQMNWTRSKSPIENPYLILDVAIGNIDGDANPDVVGIAHFEGGISLFSGDGKGGFKRLPESRSVLPTFAFGQTIELADMNGDGVDDIVTSTNLGLKVFLTKPGTPITFEDVSAGLPKPNIGNSITAARVARFQPGGWPQIVTGLLADPGDVGEARNGIGVYAFDPTKRTWDHVDKGMTRAWSSRDVQVADLDKDGNLDVLVMSPDAGGVIYLGDGHSNFTPKGRLPGVHGKGRLAVGDVNGDGWVDVVVSTPANKENPEHGGMRALLNRGEIWAAK